MASSTGRPNFDSLELHSNLKSNGLLVSILRVLLHNGNAWMSAKQLVDGCRALKLAKLRGKTPASTIQGTISTALNIARTVGVAPPLEKLKEGHHTFYRVSPSIIPDEFLQQDGTLSTEFNIGQNDSGTQDSDSSHDSGVDTDSTSIHLYPPPIKRNIENEQRLDKGISTRSNFKKNRPIHASNQPLNDNIRPSRKRKAIPASNRINNAAYPESPYTERTNVGSIDESWESSTMRGKRKQLSSQIEVVFGTSEGQTYSGRGRPRKQFSKSQLHTKSDYLKEDKKKASLNNRRISSIRINSDSSLKISQNTKVSLNEKSVSSNVRVKQRAKKLKLYDYSDSSDEQEPDSPLPHDLHDDSNEMSESSKNIVLQDKVARSNVSLKTYRPADFDISIGLEPSNFAVAQEIGYGYPRSRSVAKIKRPTKGICEDTFVVKDLFDIDRNHLARMFCLADGHGGPACSKFLKQRVPDAVEKMLQEYTSMELGNTEIQARFINEMKELIKDLNDTYLAMKREQFNRYKADPKSDIKPVDDGATLVINLFFGDRFINVNVGDSRTLFAHKTKGKWYLDFASEDHKPSLERLAIPIFQNGGEFVDHQGKKKIFDPTPKPEKPLRLGLKSARITPRVPEKNVLVNDLGIPYQNSNGINYSLNVASTVGDLLFKLDPEKPIVDCVADVTFVKPVNGTDVKFMLMSSDGLFDHLWEDNPEDQNKALVRRVGEKLDRGESAKEVLEFLGDRENRHIYKVDSQEWDDFTCILVML